MLITTVFLQHGRDIYLLRYPPHLSLGGQDFIISSALDREGESQTMAAGGYRLLAQLPTCSSQCWMVLTVYQRA